MGRVVEYNPSDPKVANAVSKFLPSANVPDYQGNPNTLVNPDLTLLWNIATQTYIVPLKYWKYDGVSDIVEMSQPEKDAIDAIDPEVVKLNRGVTGTGATTAVDALIEVERGSAANASLKWDETLETWVIGLFGQEIEVADVDIVPTNITDLGDVRDPMSPSDGDLLAWNNGNSEWENITPTHEIAVKNEGVAVTGSPFNTVNLIGSAVNATDGGSGEVDVTINAAPLVHTHVEADITDLGNYSVVGHTHTISDVTDVTASAAELNLLDLSGLTAGWVLSADTATTASWKEPAGGGGQALASVQARRTTGYTLTDTYTDITFDATDVETDATNIEHNNTNTDRIDIKADGLYLISYSFSLDIANAPATTDLQGRVRVNDTTVLAGSDGEQSGVSDSSIDGAKDNVNGNLTKTFVAELTNGDFISLQLSKEGNTSSTFANGVLVVTKMDGIKGADGATGPTGSGSNITVEDDNVAVTGTPHSTLNFGTGLDVVNDGGGQATISAQIPPSSILQVVQDSIGKGSTSSTLSQTSTPTISSGTEIASLSITPASTSNKIQLSWTFNADESSDAAYFVLLFRGSTLIRTATASGFKRGFIASADGTFLDSPATTSATTYSIRVCASGGTAYWGQNKNGNDLNGAATTGAGLTAMELSIG